MDKIIIIRSVSMTRSDHVRYIMDIPKDGVLENIAFHNEMMNPSVSNTKCLEAMIKMVAIIDHEPLPNFELNP